MLLIDHLNLQDCQMTTILCMFVYANPFIINVLTNVGLYTDVFRKMVNANCTMAWYLIYV